MQSYFVQNCGWRFQKKKFLHQKYIKTLFRKNLKADLLNDNCKKNTWDFT